MPNNAKTRDNEYTHNTGAAAPSRQPAEDLLVLCSRTRLSAREVARIKALLRGPIDWDHLIKLACEHMVEQLLYWHLARVLPEEVPAPVLETLRGIFRSVLERNLVLGGELRRLAKLFNANGITVVPYKGPILTQQVYGNLALRPSVDIDLLILRKDFQRAKRLLLSQGYRPFYHVSSAEEELRLLSACEYHLVTPSNHVMVEIHWGVWEESVFPPKAVTDVFRRSRLSSFLGVNVLTLSPEDALVVTCIHLAKHRWRELRLICDVAELIRAHPLLDWAKLGHIAEETHNKRILNLGILLARDILGAMPPEEVTAAFATDAHLVHLAHKAETTLFADNEAQVGREPLYEIIRIRDRFRDKIHSALWFALTPAIVDYQWLRLPRRLVKLYFFLRPIRLIFDYSRGALRTLL